MPAHKTLCKGLNEAQAKAFEVACKNSGLKESQAVDVALSLFCESYGIVWPQTQKHGGLRPNWFQWGKDQARDFMSDLPAEQRAPDDDFDPMELAHQFIEEINADHEVTSPSEMQQRFYIKGFMEGWKLRSSKSQ